MAEFNPSSGPLKCNQCNAQFASQDTLREHQKQHARSQGASQQGQRPMQGQKPGQGQQKS